MMVVMMMMMMMMMMFDVCERLVQFMCRCCLRYTE